MSVHSQSGPTTPKEHSKQNRGCRSSAPRLEELPMKELRTKGAEEAMEVAEASRETEWEKPSFVGDLFIGKLNLPLIYPFPEQSADDKKTGDEYLEKLERFLAENVDPEEIDRTG